MIIGYILMISSWLEIIGEDAAASGEEQEQHKIRLLGYRTMPGQDAACRAAAPSGAPAAAGRSQVQAAGLPDPGPSPIQNPIGVRHNMP
eukprot:179366-Hanusia_phi.AAC.1